MDPVVVAALVQVALAGLQAWNAYTAANGLTQEQADAKFEEIKQQLAERDPALLKKVWENKS